MRNTPACHSGNETPKTSLTLTVFKREFAGRLAAIKKSRAAIGKTASSPTFIATPARRA